SEEDWQTALQLKFMGYVRCMKAVIPHMLKQGGGRIVNIIGNDGVKPIGIELTPSAANAADLAVTVALAEQYGKYNICINAVNPDRKSTRLNSSHQITSYAVIRLKKNKNRRNPTHNS